MCIVSVDEVDIAVGIALMPLSQKQLDESSLKPIPVFKAAALQNTADILKHYPVQKYGAMTGMR